MKIPRNSACPCGSGKKYIRCCGSVPGKPPSEVRLPEVVSKDIHACECGKVVAWLPSPSEKLQPYEIQRPISTEPDGTQTVIVSTQDLHYCKQYSALADFIQKAVNRSYAREIRIRLPNAEPFVLSWSQGDRRVNASNGRSGANLRSYGSLNLETGRYRVRRQSSILEDLLEAIDEDPFDFDWSVGGSQTDCCFCGRPLNNPRSVRRGYGPICAQNVGLPW